MGLIIGAPERSVESTVTRVLDDVDITDPDGEIVTSNPAELAADIAGDEGPVCTRPAAGIAVVSGSDPAAIVDRAVDVIEQMTDDDGYCAVGKFAVTGVDVLGSDVGAVAAAVRRVTDRGVPVLVVGPSVTLDSELAPVLDSLADLEASGARERILAEARERCEEMTGSTYRGRPPVGFDVVDGELEPGDDFVDVRDTLELADSEEISRAAAARRLDVSRATIQRALENDPRRAFYGLDDDGD